MNKKNIIKVLLLILIIVISYFAFTKIFKKEPKQIYEVAIVVRSQNNKDSVEDRKTSLKKGDVLVIQKEKHNWSKTEKISYLILKMNLTEDQKIKLTKAKEKDIKFKDLSKEDQDMINREKEEAKKQDREYEAESKKETLIAREYYVDFDKYFADFKPNDLLKGQPFVDEVFDWGVVRKKK